MWNAEQKWKLGVQTFSLSHKENQAFASENI